MSYMRDDAGVGAPGGVGFNLSSLSTSLNTLTIPEHRYIKASAAAVFSCILKNGGATAVSLPIVAGTNAESIKTLYSPNAHTGSVFLFLK